MNNAPSDIRLQDLLDRHANGAAAGDLLAEARAQADGEPLARDLALTLALARELPARLPAARRAAMQAALQDAFQVQQRTEERRAGLLAGFLPRRLAFRLGAAVLAGTLALGGGVAASAESLPGDTLYPIKRAAEAARLAFSWAPESRARVWMELSDLRHQEIQQLDAAGRPSPDSLVEAWLAAHRQAREEAQASGDPQLLQAVDEQAARHARDLEQLPQPGASDAADRLRGGAGQEPQPASPPQDPASIAQPVSAATASPIPATATTASGEQGGAGQSDPVPTQMASATPYRPAGGGSKGTPPSQATRDASATERAGRPTDEPGRGGRGGRGDDPRRATEEARRRATEEARRATERARRGQQVTPDPSQPTAQPRPTLPPGIGPTEGPPPGPPRPTRPPFPNPDPERTPGAPGERRTPPPWPTRNRGTPPTVAPDPTEQPVPTTLSGEAPTPVTTATPEARSDP